MNIQPDDPKWTAYVLGELNDTERRVVERELESSPEAREIVDEIRMTTLLLKDELAKEAPVTLLAEQRLNVRKAVEAPKSSTVWRWAIPALAAAAAVVVVATMSLPSLLRSRQAVTDMAMSRGQESAPELPPPAVVPKLDEPQASKRQELQVANEREFSEQKAKESNDLDALRDGKLQVAPTEADRSDRQALSKDEARQDALKQQQAPLSGVLGGVLRAQEQQAPAPPSQQQFGQQGQQGARNTAGEMASRPIVAAAPPPPPPPPLRISPAMAGRGGASAPLDDKRLRYNTEAYDRIEDNQFKNAPENPLATFSIDVDTAAYANLRRFLNQNQLPPKDSVRIEELINYFNYDYAQPAGQHPIAVHAEVAAAPWKPEHRLVKIGIKAKDIDVNRRPPSNLVFLIDVSGSMMPSEKLPLLKSGLKMLVEKLGENDRVSIVLYAGNAGLLLRPTTGDKKEIIMQALDRLEAGGSTNGADGIQLAYNTAVANFIRGGVNRVILCTDGDFNVGTTNQGDLTRLIEDKARSGVFLSVLGFGMGNLKDSTMEKLADRGNGNYAYIDSISEARKVLVEEMGGTLMTIAKDVKIQVDFNPEHVNAYRLIGYENRVLQNQDFNDDTKDAGDMGAGHTVTALFEIVPRGMNVSVPTVEESKYQQPAARAAADRRVTSNELLTVRVRYKKSDEADSTRFDVPLVDRRATFDSASTDFRFAAAVAEFGMILRESAYKGNATLDHVLNIAERSRGQDRNGYREEFVRLVRKARALRDLRQD